MRTHTIAHREHNEALSQLHKRMLQLARSAVIEQSRQGKKSDLSPSSDLFFKSLNTIKVTKFFSGKEVKLAEKHQRLQTVLKHARDGAQHVAKVHELLREVRSPFICDALYYDEEGNVVTCQSEMDLFQFCGKYKVRDARVFQRLVGQIILMVEALHEKNLVHRDLKPENVLVIDPDGKVYLKLTDFNALVRVDEQNRLLPQETDLRIIRSVPSQYPDRFESPQLKQVGEDTSQYAQLDLKAVDCYALGGTLFDLQALYPDIKKDFEYLHLIASLRTNGTIEKAKAVRFFGETQQARDKFFAELLAEANYDVYIDGFLVRSNTSKPGHPFYLLDSKLKDLSVLLSKIENQLQFLSFPLEQQEAKEIGGNDLYSINALHENLHALNANINNVKKDGSLRFIHETVREIQNNVKFLCEQAQPYVLLLQQVKVSELESARLEKIVEASVNEYIKVNKLDESKHCLTRFFSLHGETGRKRAMKLQTDVGNLFREGKSPAEIFALIHQVLTVGGGRWWANSLKTILAKNLKQLGSELPLAEWPQFLSQTSRAHEQRNECKV